MSATKKNYIVVLVIFIGFALFCISRGDYSIQLSLADHCLTVDGPEEFLYSVDFAQVESVVCSDEWEVGSCVAGNTKYGYQFGTWENDKFGQYQLCAMTRNNVYMIVTTADKEMLVLNFESPETTEEFCQTLIQYLSDEGYAVMS